ncbi:ATP-binding cassette domain-containing protein [Conyzicola nivalis]|uniref:ABC transporter n=1 Tax=Conyzicola nivalis TaxID=1477021 RepID=A0A916WJ58_9MICO|nr:ATP-binding cassette domain-containing protein [Conyzicola nivalis]GGB03114.1 ABC transporter [Conyzicola nivalis]
MTTDDTPAIAAYGLRKAYGHTTAVEEVSFSVPRGRVLGLLGPNGAGKTTSMRMLLGLASIDGGRAHIHGRPYAELDEPARTVGAVLDAGGLHPGRTARQHLRIAASMAGVDDTGVQPLLDDTGLTAAADRPIRTYSLGMRQRVALATALLGDPNVLVLDEPANGLDPAGTRWLRDLVHAFAARGGAVLLSSHILAEVAHVAHDVVVIDHGRVVGGGRVDELTDEHGGDLESFYLRLTGENAGVI